MPMTIVREVCRRRSVCTARMAKNNPWSRARREAADARACIARALQNLVERKHFRDGQNLRALAHRDLKRHGSMQTATVNAIAGVKGSLHLQLVLEQGGVDGPCVLVAWGR